MAELQHLWDLASQKLAALEQQKILETRVEEKLRLQHLIAETSAERDRIEQQMQRLLPSEETTPLPPALQALQDIVCTADRPADLNLLPETLAEILRHAPRHLTEYRLNRIADWSQPRYELDKRFVQLTLLLDKGEDAQGPRWESSRQFQDLREVLPETLATPALVLLGPPGSGKSRCCDGWNGIWRWTHYETLQ